MRIICHTKTIHKQDFNQMKAKNHCGSTKQNSAASQGNRLPSLTQRISGDKSRLNWTFCEFSLSKTSVKERHAIHDFLKKKKI